MQFHFRLRPVEDIAPWGSAQGQPSLSWFGLTDGWFWIEVGGQELFRYSQAILEHRGRLYPDAGPSLMPYTDYNVVRYWEDILGMLPSILDPLPADLAARVADAQSWQEWESAAERWRKDCTDTEDEPYYMALLWWAARTWDAGHIHHEPAIWLWRVGDTIHVRWDNGRIVDDRLPVWEATADEITLPVSEFLDAVTSFHERFLAEMWKRVEAAQTGWSRPDIAIDLAGLAHEQQDRSSWLVPALSQFAVEARRVYPWAEVRAAIATIEQDQQSGS